MYEHRNDPVAFSLPRALLGIVVAAIFAGSVAGGVQLLVWGYRAPTWYLAPCAVLAIGVGALGAYLGGGR